MIIEKECGSTILTIVYHLFYGSGRYVTLRGRKKLFACFALPLPGTRENSAVQTIHSSDPPSLPFVAEFINKVSLTMYDCANGQIHAEH